MRPYCVAGQVRVGEWVRCCVGGRSDALLVIIDDALLSPLLHACSRAALPTAQCIVQPASESAAGLSAPAADCDRLPASSQSRGHVGRHGQQRSRSVYHTSFCLSRQLPVTASTGS